MTLGLNLPDEHRGHIEKLVYHHYVLSFLFISIFQDWVKSLVDQELNELQRRSASWIFSLVRTTISCNLWWQIVAEVVDGVTISSLLLDLQSCAKLQQLNNPLWTCRLWKGWGGEQSVTVLLDGRGSALVDALPLPTCTNKTWRLKELSSLAAMLPSVNLGFLSVSLHLPPVTFLPTFVLVFSLRSNTWVAEVKWSCTLCWALVHLHSVSVTDEISALLLIWLHCSSAHSVRTHYQGCDAVWRWRNQHSFTN